MTEEIKSECQSFGKGWNDTVDDCKKCEDNYPEEYKVCMKMTQEIGDQPAEPKQEVSNQPAEPEQKIEKVEKVEKKVSLKGLCRDLIKQGCTEKEVKKQLAAIYIEQGKDEKYANGRAKAIYGDILKEGIVEIEKRPEEQPEAGKEG